MDKLEATLKIAGIEDNLTIVKVRYALEILKSEVLKLVIIAILFILLGYREEFFFAIVFLLPVRIFSGGSHLNSNLGCFLISFGFLLSSVILLPMILIPPVVFIPIAVVAVFTIALLSPVASFKRLIKTEARRVYLKRMTLVTLIVESIVLSFLWGFGSYTFFVIGVWVVALQALQLAVTWAYRKMKGDRDV